jgi:hypothetical protein
MQKQQLIDQIIQQNNQIIKNALSTSYQTEEIATDTFGELSNQGIQLKNLQDGLDNIGENQHNANNHLNIISSISGYIKNKFGKTSLVPIKNKTRVDPIKNKITVDREISTNTINNKKTQSKSETNKLLDELSVSLLRLKEMGNNVSIELQNQSKTLDDLNEHVDETNNNMKKLNDRIKKF